MSFDCYVNFEELAGIDNYDLTEYSFLEGMQKFKEFYEFYINRVINLISKVAGSSFLMGQDNFDTLVHTLSAQDLKFERFITIDFPMVDVFYKEKLKEIVGYLKTKSNNKINYANTIELSCRDRINLIDDIIIWYKRKKPFRNFGYPIPIKPVNFDIKEIACLRVLFKNPDHDRVIFQYDGREEIRKFSEAGAVNSRTGKATKKWEKLIKMAEKRGKHIDFNENQISDLNHLIMKMLPSLQTRPIVPDGKGAYKTLFQCGICDKNYAIL
jgi:hypothetical protein